MINTSEVAIFIDSMIVKTKEEEYNKVVENIVKILVENDLYVKLKNGSEMLGSCYNLKLELRLH